MDNNRILIVDDDMYNARILSAFLTKRGLHSTVCSNGREALDELKKESYPVVITDLEMPEVDGLELIENIRAISENITIFILSAHSELSVIVKTMKMGADDYIVKPANCNDVFMKLLNTCGTLDMAKTEKIIQKEKRDRLESQLEWYTWQEKILSRKLELNDTSLFEGLRRSFTQGSGFGSLLTLIDIICANGKGDSDGMLRIESGIIDVLKDNISYAKKGLYVFSEIENIERNGFDIAEYTVGEIYDIIEGIIESFSSMIHLKDNAVHLCDKKKVFSDRNIMINADYFKKMFSELILNALKFSRKSSPVTVIIDMTGDRFFLHVMNLPDKNDKGVTGITADYENIIFEPFFRMTKTLYEEFDTLDFGIGLTMCEKIAAKFKGSIRLFNVTDHSDIISGPQTKVCCEVQIPLV